jgi:hypothetical protein
MTDKVTHNKKIIDEFETLKKEISNNKSEIVKKKQDSLASNDAKASLNTVNEIIEDLANASGGSTEGSTICLCILLQRGGTSPKQANKVSETWKGARISLGMVRNSCAKHKISVRKLARGMAQTIAIIMEYLGEDGYRGNLSKKYLEEHPDASDKDLIWTSDFQTFNLECPERIREWLIKDYNTRFKK